MGLLRRRSVQRAGALALLLAVLAVPCALSRHHHGADATDSSRDGCAICAATVHAPALLAPPAPPLALVTAGAAPPAALLCTAWHARQRAHATRAPPSILRTLVA